MKNKETLCKGIFWITTLQAALSAENFLAFRLPCDTKGILTAEGTAMLNEQNSSKSGDNLNHRKVWNTLPGTVTGRHDYRYYPRGRVEIRNGKATVFYNPIILQSDIKRYIIPLFGLTEQNGVRVKYHADGSRHYENSVNKKLF